MDKGNLLISANGKGHRAITNLWINTVVGVIVLIGFGFGFGLWATNAAEAQWNAKSATYTNDALGQYLKSVAAKNRAASKAAVEAAVEETNTQVLCGMVVLAVLILAYTAFAVSRIGGTAVAVYENAVCGKSVEYKSLEFQLVDFELPYNQVSSVDVIKNAVIINTANVRHKIYAMTADKVRDAIMSRKA